MRKVIVRQMTRMRRSGGTEPSPLKPLPMKRASPVVRKPWGGDPPGGHEQGHRGHARDLRPAGLEVEQQGEGEQQGSEPQADALPARPGLGGGRGGVIR